MSSSDSDSDTPSLAVDNIHTLTSSDEDNEPVQTNYPSKDLSTATSSDEDEPNIVQFKQTNELTNKKRKLTATSSEDDESKRSNISAKKVHKSNFKGYKALGQSVQNNHDSIEASKHRGGESFTSRLHSPENFNRKRKFAPIEDGDSKNNRLTDTYSSKSLKMMQNMGYKSDKGLGKSGQGRIEPIAASSQKGRCGLGLKLDGLHKAATEYEDTLEVLSIPEKVDWLINDNQDISSLNRDLLSSWIIVGNKKEEIQDETKFCDPEILTEVLRHKSAFDYLGDEDMRKARTKSNPFETIRGNIFINRAAVKMANMDCMFDYMFTNPLDEFGQPVLKPDDLLYFADVCAGPGGFTEYILWRNKWNAKGFGFTLKSENDFKLHDFFAGHPETFDPYYGPKGNGDVYDPTNILAFTEYVLKQTEYGVHFMMADGGFSVAGKENIQEILSKRLYLCQMLVALHIVRTKGHFVVKLFDLFTPFSVGLVYLMYKCFEQISICKPNTSRPANSERYLVCKWKKSNTGSIQRHLFEVNNAMFENNDSIDTLELVPYDVLKADEKFFQYIYDSNNLIGQNQIAGLIKIAAYCSNPSLNDPRQTDVRNQCLSLWKLPNAMRTSKKERQTNDQYCAKLLQEYSNDKSFLYGSDKSINGDKLDQAFSSIYGLYFVALDVCEDEGKNIRTFFMSKGGREVLQYNKTPKTGDGGYWSPVKDVCLEISPETLIYGEIVKELCGEGKSQITINALHIIDGIILGGVDIRSCSLKARNKMCEKFAKALNKPFKTSKSNTDSTSQEVSTPIRCKKLFELKDIESFFNNLDYFKLKDGNKTRLGYYLKNDIDPDRFFAPKGLMFLNEVRNDYLLVFSSTHKTLYYYEKKTKNSFYRDTMKGDKKQLDASFRNTYMHRLVWQWVELNQVEENGDFIKSEHLIYRSDINEFLKSRTK